MTSSARPSRHPWAVLILLSAAQFMVTLDVTVANVALPSIGEALGFAPGDLQWVITAYVLVAGGLLLLGGRAADLLGRRRVFLAGLLLFAAASLAAGLAASPAALVGARAAQGIGAALLTPAALSIVATTYSGERRTRALSVWGAVGSAGAAAGLLLGGMLTTWLGWEWVFLVNVPVGVLVAVLVARLVPATPPAPAERRRLDPLGAVSLVAGLGALIWAIEGAAQHGWGSSRTTLLLALSGASLAGFAAIERRVPRPLVPPRTWRMRPVVAGAAVMLAGTGILVGAFFLGSLLLQDVLGASALETGLAFLPVAVAIGLAAHAASHLLPRAGSRAVAAVGLALMAVATALLSRAGAGAAYAGDLLPGLLVLGAGAGLVFPAASVAAMGDATYEDAGLASGLLTTAHETGAALGVAVLSAVAAAGGAGTTLAPDHGFLVAAHVAGGIALLALLLLPSVRPAGAARVAMH